jgi:hypothetical protein
MQRSIYISTTGTDSYKAFLFEALWRTNMMMMNEKDRQHYFM